ncbi:MAG: hypothetical protein COC12_12995 [Rhodobacteraceae bacterium]|nr:MAG: hypothetical protein COC12_12995 [Paracoccaceae bacterium]
MHRKFITLVLSAALAIAGLSAAPARAGNDTAKLFAGLAALALIGAAIQSNKRNQYVVSRNPPYTPPVTVTRPIHTPHTSYYSKPPAPRINRLDLPGGCLRAKSVNGRQRNLFGNRCLETAYAFNGTLPRACRLGYWNGANSRIGYEPQCLREYGYRFTRR